MKDPEEINPYDLNSIKKFSLMTASDKTCIHIVGQIICNDGKINSIKFRSLAIFHIQELEDRIKELEKEITELRKVREHEVSFWRDAHKGEMKRSMELARKIESYKAYCENNGLQGL